MPDQESLLHQLIGISQPEQKADQALPGPLLTDGLNQLARDTAADFTRAVILDTVNVGPPVLIGGTEYAHFVQSFGEPADRDTAEPSHYHGRHRHRFIQRRSRSVGHLVQRCAGEYRR